MNIDKMKAGRETDALIAERVMGFSEIWHGTMPSYWDGDAQRLLPRYSTDIAAAWEVDKPEWRWLFCEHPKRLTILLWDGFLGDDPIATAHVKWDEVETKSEAYALGRCRAALKAVEVSDAHD